jgi:hypothetical protein
LEEIISTVDEIKSDLSAEHRRNAWWSIRVRPDGKENERSDSQWLNTLCPITASLEFDFNVTVLRERYAQKDNDPRISTDVGKQTDLSGSVERIDSRQRQHRLGSLCKNIPDAVSQWPGGGINELRAKSELESIRFGLEGLENRNLPEDVIFQEIFVIRSFLRFLRWSVLGKCPTNRFVNSRSAFTQFVIVIHTIINYMGKVNTMRNRIRRFDRECREGRIC